MYLVRSLRTFIGTNAERVAAGLAAFLAGDEFIETDTGLVYIHNGMAWLLNSSAGSPGGADTQVQFNDGGVFGGDSKFTFDKTTGLLTVVGALTVDSSDDTNAVVSTLSSEISTQFSTFAKQSFIAKNDADEEVEYVRMDYIIRDNSDGDEGASFAIYRRINGAMAAVFSMGNTVNEIAGNTYITGNLYAGSSGDLASIENTEIVFNDGENDVNFRIAGDSVEFGYFYDAGLNRHGFGTGTPSVKVHVVETSGTVAIFEENASGEVGINSFYNPNTTDNNGALIRFDTDTTGTGATARSQIAQIGVVFTVHNHSTRTGNIVFRNYQSGAFGTRATIGLGVQIGAPTGGDKGAGTINVATNIYKNNTAYTNPDYALEHWATGEIKQFANRDGAQNYYRLSLDESEKFVRKNLHLPRISRDSAGIFDMADMALEKIEEAHIYIYELHNRIKVLEQRLLA